MTTKIEAQAQALEKAKVKTKLWTEEGKEPRLYINVDKPLFLIAITAAVLGLQGCAALGVTTAEESKIKIKNQANAGCSVVLDEKAAQPITVDKRKAASVGGGLAGLLLGGPLGIGSLSGGLAGFWAGDLAAGEFLCKEAPAQTPKR